MNTKLYPVAIIGAGPVGLAAAAQLELRGEKFVVLEAGAQAGASIRKWAHVQVFSPWRYMVDEAARALLGRAGWQAPDDDGYPTGGEFVAQYLEPLVALPQLAGHIRYNARVTDVARLGFDKLKSSGREGAPFVLSYTQAGREHELFASAVIDASGTYEQPNPLGASGVPAPGERANADRIFYGIPDVNGAHAASYAGRRVLVVGSGHSAFNAIIDLMKLHAQHPDTRISWAVRRQDVGQMFGGGSADQLSARGELGARVQSLVQQGAIQLVKGFRIARITRMGGALHVDGGDNTLEVDEIVACTGFRPNLEMIRELRHEFDDRTEAPRALAPLIDPNLHSCGSVPPHGYAELKHAAEPGFYVVGMKSYGRAPTFLMLTGYEQVRSVVAAIAGDMQAALDVRLVLPETGVCSGPGGSCCTVDSAIGATAEQTGDCGCNTGCCAAPSKPAGFISLESLR